MTSRPSVDDATRSRRREVALVVALFAFAAIAAVDALLYARGAWFTRPVTGVVHRALWSVLWLPGIMLGYRLLRRERRWVLAAGLVLQAAAIALMWMPDRLVSIGRASGGLGVVFPLVAGPRADTPPRKWVALLLGIGAPAWFYWVEHWSLAVFVLAFAWLEYARAIWPAVDEHLGREEQRWRESRAARWFDRIALAIAIAALGCGVAAALIYGAVVWLAPRARQ